MNRILIGLFFLSLTGISQVPITNKKKETYREQINTATTEQINQLKDGVLLVSLKTRNNSINALRKYGKNKQADELEKRQAEHNLTIISAFKTNFNFCPTYFFYSDNSIHVKENQLDKVIFLNENMNPDTTIQINNKKFLVAEFGTVVQDTAKYFSHYTYEPDGNLSVKRVSHYYGGPSLGYNALIISSEKLNQLRRPFPYYVKTYSEMPKKEVVFDSVSTMNRKLNKFYKRKNKTQKKK